MRIRIKKNLGLHRCDRCSRALRDRDFEQCGISLRPTPSVFFDYKCPGCAFVGRYTYGFDPATDLKSSMGILRKFLVFQPPKSFSPQRRFNADGERLADF